MIAPSSKYILAASLLLSHVLAAPLPNPDPNPRIVYVTQTQPTEFTTVYNFNTATVTDAGEIKYSTDWANAVQYTSTEQPAAAVAPTSTTPVAVVTSAAPVVASSSSSSPAAAVETSAAPVVQASSSSSPAAAVETSSTPVAVAAPETSSSISTEAAAGAAPATSSTSSTEAAAVVVTTSQGAATSAAPVAATTTSTSTPAEADTLTNTAAAAADPSGTIVSNIIPSAIVYSPYNNDGSCKDATTVLSDLELIHSKQITELRIYATDCNSLETVQPAAASLGMKISQGMWMSSAGVDSIDDQVTAIIEYGSSNGWDIFTNLIVGNEAILEGYCTVSELLAKASSVISQFRSAGYTGDVLTAEPPKSYEENPSLCTSGVFDKVGINSHSYYDANSAASDAGTFVKGQLAITENVCSVPVLITETGYPSAGDTYGKNVPTVENQAIAIKALLEELNGQITVLTTYNDYWKDPGPNNIEQHFGVIQLLE